MADEQLRQRRLSAAVGCAHSAAHPVNGGRGRSLGSKTRMMGGGVVAASFFGSHGSRLRLAERRLCNSTSDAQIETQDCKMTGLPERGTDHDQTQSRRSRSCMMVAMMVGLAWAAAAGFRAYATWPHLPLDISATDAATRAAFDSAVRQHTITYLIVALIPFVVLLPLMSRVCARRQRL